MLDLMPSSMQVLMQQGQGKSLLLDAEPMTLSRQTLPWERHLRKLWLRTSAHQFQVMTAMLQAVAWFALAVVIQRFLLLLLLYLPLTRHRMLMICRWMHGLPVHQGPGQQHHRRRPQYLQLHIVAALAMFELLTSTHDCIDFCQGSCSQTTSSMASGV